jgi:hypothetical protein
VSLSWQSGPGILSYVTAVGVFLVKWQCKHYVGMLGLEADITIEFAELVRVEATLW